MRSLTSLLPTISLFGYVFAAPATEPTTTDSVQANHYCETKEYKCECYPNPSESQQRLLYSDCSAAADVWAQQYPRLPRGTDPTLFYWLTHDHDSRSPNRIFAPQLRRSGTCDVTIDYWKTNAREDEPDLQTKDLDSWVYNEQVLAEWCEGKGQFGGEKVKHYQGASSATTILTRSRGSDKDYDTTDTPEDGSQAVQVTNGDLALKDIDGVSLS